MEIVKRIIPAKPRSKELYFEKGGSSAIISGGGGSSGGGGGSSYWTLIDTDENDEPLDNPYIKTTYPVVGEKNITAYGVNNTESNGNGGISSIADANDVILTNLTTDDLLKYNGTHWENIAMSSLITGGGGASTIDGIVGLQTALDSKLNKTVFEDMFEKVEISSGEYAIKAKYNFFGIGAVSAYGLDLSGGGGSGGSGGDYILPTASATTLGGVKVGNGLTINNGVLSADVQSSSYSLPTATSTTLGGIKIGTNVAISNGTISVHNPLTIGTANGLSLSNQQLSLSLANTTNNGALSANDKKYIDLLRTLFEHDTTNNAIKALKPFYSVGEVSAYGLGGTDNSKLSSWTGYTSAMANYYVPASLLVPFRNDTLSRLDSLEAGGGGTEYILPIASATTLGGVKVGSNLSISSGVLSATNTTYGVATTSANGLMSSGDKTKLNGIATGANNYTHPATHPADMITAGTFAGIVKAQNNTSYTTKQVRNMILSTGNAVSSQMANGDIWIKYE